MNHKIWLLLLIIMPLWGSADTAQAPAASADAENPFQSGLLWSVRRDGHATSYVFGTVHSGDPRVMALADALLPIIQLVDSIAPELELSVQDTTLLTNQMVYQDATILQDVIGAALFDQVAAKLRTKGIPRIFAARLKPWAAIMMLSVPDDDSLNVLDLELIARSKAVGKSVEPLETMAEQIETFSQTPEADQITILKDTVEQYDQLEAYFESLIQAYLDENLSALQRLTDEMPSSDREVSDQFMARLLEDRNHRMVDRVLPKIETNSWLIAVGAMHLPGETGILQLLTDQGWQVERVRLTGN